jgi:Na+/melibiose symporter-like transporter
MNTSTAVLAQTHPEHSAQVITEANAAAGWVGLLSPLLLGLALGAGLGWQAGMMFTLLAVIAAMLGLVVADRSILRVPGPADVRPIAPELAQAVVEMSPESAMAGAEAAARAQRSEHPRSPGPPGSSATALPRVFWLAMLALFAAAATEFAINFWGSTLIQDQTGAAASAASAAMSASVAGIAIGRTIGSGFTARFGPHRMLLGGFALALAGFAVLWAAGVLILSVVGLFLAGLGLATLFPLVLDRGIALSDGKPDLALSRVALVLGLAIGGAPFALGALGAVMPVQVAMLLVPVIVVAGLVGVVGSKPATSQQE